MNDFKLIGKTEEGTQKKMQIARTLSDEIHSEFGLDKNAKIVLKKGKLVHSQTVMLDITREIQERAQGKRTIT
jgi:hypothetical protein